MYSELKRHLENLSLSDESSDDSRSGVVLSDSDSEFSRPAASHLHMFGPRTCNPPPQRAYSHMESPPSRPPSVARSGHTSVSSPAELIYAEIRKPPRPKPRAGPRAKKRVCFREAVSLSSIKEISPVSAAAQNSPLIEQRSALGHPSPFKSPARPVPKTNPYFTLPRSSSATTPQRPKLGLRERNIVDRPVERVSSYYDSDDASLSSCGDSSGANSTFGMHRYLNGLKSFGIKGELFLTASLNRGLLTIQIDEARHLQAGGSGVCNSYVRLSLMPDQEKRTQCRTGLVPRSNSPVFNQTFTIELLPEDYEKRLLISVWNRNLASQKSTLLGCMAFTVKHLVNNNKQVDGWYFLLAPSFGRHKHLAVDKVSMLTYYGSVDSGLQNAAPEQSKPKPKPQWTIPILQTPEDSDTDYSHRAAMDSTDTSTSCSRGWDPSSTSATSSSTGSFAMRSTGTFFSNLIEHSPLRKLSMREQRRRAASSTHLDAPKERQSNKCHSCKTPRRKVTFTAHSEEVSTSSADNVPAENDVDRLNVTERLLIDRTAIHGSFENLRRAQSFTESRGRVLPPNLVDGRKISATEMGSSTAIEGKESKKKRSFTAPITKKFSFLKKRSGADSSLIIAQGAKLSKEEVSKWACTFDNLLRHKHGVALFRLFLQREFSEENIDFWIACEEFKEAKDSKLLAKAKEIYAEFVAVQAPKEVNLDSDTRTATEAAINSCSRSAFENAQYRIEHLMEKDSYPRFLKSDLYLDLLNTCKK